ncbi:MAG: glycosyltransferase family 39 protein [candidate division Zixibacteria bacterium]
MRGWREKLYYYKSRLDLQYLFITAIVIRLIYLALMLGQVEYSHLLEIAPDTIRYVNIAEGILNLDVPDENAVIIFGPGYGFFLSIVFFLFGNGALGVLLIQIIISSLSCLLIYKLGKELTESKAVGLIAGYLLAISFTSISLANIVLSDTLFFFLFLLGNVFFIIALKHDNRRYFIYSGIILGLSAYVRSIGQLWPLAMLLLIFILPVNNKSLSWWKSRFTRLKRAWIAPVIALLLISVWIGRNYIKHDYPLMALAGPVGVSKVVALSESRVNQKSTSEIVTGWVNKYKHKHNIKEFPYIDYARIYYKEAYSSFLRNPTVVINAYKDMLWGNIISVNELYRTQLPQLKDKILSRMGHYRVARIPQLCFWIGIAGLAGLFIRKKYSTGIYLGIIHLYFICLCGFAQWQGSRVYYPNQIAWIILFASLIVSIIPLSRKFGELILGFRSFVENLKKKQSSTLNKSIAITIILIPCLVFLGHALLYGNYIIDDAGISYTYAKNLASGHGLVHNIDGEVVEGYSNPLWVFILALFIKVGIFHPVITPKIISIFFVILMLVIIDRIFRTYTEHPIRAPIYLIIAILLVTNVSLTIWAVSGLENGLYGLLIISGIYRLYIELTHHKRFVISGLIYFLIAITRPEGIVYFVAAFFISMFWIHDKKQFKIYILNLVWFLSCFGVYHLWHYIYFSEWLPNTYYAKVRDVPILYKLTEFNRGGWAYIRNCFSSYGLYLLIPLAAAALWGRKKLLAAIFFASLLISLALPIISWGDWMMQYRILHPLILILIILAGLGFITVFNFLGNRQKLVGLSGIIVILLSGYLVFKSERQYQYQKSHFTVPFTAIQSTIHGLNRDLGDSLGIVHPTVLCADVGATSYYGGLRVYDVGLLADYHLARYRFKDYYADYVFDERRPDFISYQGGAVAQFTRMRNYPKFNNMYVAYKERHLDENYFGENVYDGQYVRKDIIARDEIPFFAKPIKRDGFALNAYYCPNRISPKASRIPICLYWEGDLLEPSLDKLNISLTDPDGSLIFDSLFKIGYEWYPPDIWDDNKMICQNVFIPLNANDRDSMYLSIQLDNEDIDSSKLIIRDCDIGNDELYAIVSSFNKLKDIIPGIKDYASLMHLESRGFWNSAEGKVQINDLAKKFLGDRASWSFEKNHDSLWMIIMTMRQIMPQNDMINGYGKSLHGYYISAAQKSLDSGWQSHSKAFEFFNRAIESYPSDPKPRKILEQMRPWIEYLNLHKNSLMEYGKNLPLTKMLEFYRHFYRESKIKFKPFEKFFITHLLPHYDYVDKIDSLDVYDQVTLMQLRKLRGNVKKSIKLNNRIQTFGNKKLELLDSRLIPLDSGKYLFESVFIPHNIADKQYVLSLNIAGRSIDDIPEKFRHRGTFPYSFYTLPPIPKLKNHIPNYAWQILNLEFEPYKYEITVFVSGGPPWHPLFNDHEGDNFVDVE